MKLSTSAQHVSGYCCRPKGFQGQRSNKSQSDQGHFARDAIFPIT